MPTKDHAVTKSHSAKPSTGGSQVQAFRSQTTGKPVRTPSGGRGRDERVRNLSRFKDSGSQKKDKGAEDSKLPALKTATRGDKKALSASSTKAPLHLPAIGESPGEDGDKVVTGGQGALGAKKLVEEERARERDEEGSELDEEGSERDEEGSELDEEGNDLDEEELGESVHDVRGVNKQGALGDCWLISSINAFALHAPEMLTKRLVMAADGQSISHIRLNYIDEKGKADGVYDIPVSVKEIPAKLKGGKTLKYANAGKKVEGLSERELIAPLIELATAKLRMPDKGNSPLDTKAKKDLGYQRLVASPGRNDNHTSSAFAMLAPPGAKILEVPLGANTDVATLGPLLKEAGTNGYPAVLQSSKYSVASGQTLDYKKTTGASGLVVSHAQHAITVKEISNEGSLSFHDQGNQKKGNFKNAEAFKEPAESSTKSVTQVKVTKSLLDACAPSEGEATEVIIKLNMGGREVQVKLSAERLAEAREKYDARQKGKDEAQEAYLKEMRVASDNKIGKSKAQKEEEEAKVAEAKATSMKAAKLAGRDMIVKVWIPVVYSPEKLTMTALSGEQSKGAELGTPGKLEDLLGPKPTAKSTPKPTGVAKVTVVRKPHPPSTAKPSGVVKGAQIRRGVVSGASKAGKK